jgi:hypothetical protein
MLAIKGFVPDSYDPRTNAVTNAQMRNRRKNGAARVSAVAAHPVRDRRCAPVPSHSRADLARRAGR